MMTKRGKLIILAPLALVGMALFVALGGEIVKLLWNWLLPPLFGFRQLTFWQALGMLALCRILFGGFGLMGSSRSRARDRAVYRWGNMTPEEKERFRQGIRARFGFGPSSDERHET